jgi:hypothetical protein
VNTEILGHPQPEIERDQVTEDLRKHPVPTRAPRQEPTHWNPTIPVIGECDLLIASGVTSPITLQTQPFAEGWRLIKGKRVREIERELQANGWNLFYLIPDVHASGIAHHPDRAVRKALRKIFRSALEQGANMLEIASLNKKDLFGLHRVEVTAKLRHIQESPYLFLAHEEMRQRSLRVKPVIRTIRLMPHHYGRDWAEHKPF